MIGTLTFHEALNYGAALQTYALQKSIQKLGQEAEVINYSCPKIFNNYQRNHTLKGTIGWVLRTQIRNEKTKKFNNFYKQHVNIGKPVQRGNLDNYCKKYSSVVVGSDQVWNPDLTNCDTAYFLDFDIDNSKKKAYAASIGTKKWEPQYESKLANLVVGFDMASVRERSAADYIESLTGKSLPVVCDPTLLLDASDWSQIAVEPNISEPYILLYCLNKPEKDCLNWAKRQAQLLKCELVVLNYSAIPIAGVINVRNAGPEEFLGYFKNAQLVVTHSFHGCCFSIAFQRDFYWFKSSEFSPSLASRTSRIEDLLMGLSLGDRIAYEGLPMLGNIDYDRVNKDLSAWRNESVEILSYML